MTTERFTITDGKDDRDYFELYAAYIVDRVEGDILDIGCGEGWLTKRMAGNPRVKSIVAVDKFENQPKENMDKKIKYVHRDIVGMEISDRFDFIVSTEFIEHITRESLEFLLSQIKYKGRFLGSTPNKLVETRNMFHLQEYPIDELRMIFQNAGLTGDLELIRSDLTVWDVK